MEMHHVGHLTDSGLKNGKRSDWPINTVIDEAYEDIMLNGNEF